MTKYTLRNPKTIIIAEGCDNHFGSLSNAKKMVLKAKEAGADVIKFQLANPEDVYSKDAFMADYQQKKWQEQINNWNE